MSVVIIFDIISLIPLKKLAFERKAKRLDKHIDCKKLISQFMTASPCLLHYNSNRLSHSK